MTNTKWTISLVICLALAGCQPKPAPRVVDCRGNIEKPIASCVVSQGGEVIDCGCISVDESRSK